MIEAVNALLAMMSPEQRKSSCFPAGSNMWRHWQNTELYVEHYGLRLDEISEPLRDAVLAVLRVSMSPHGYELSRDVMKLNRFLGDIVHGPAVMGEWSYIFCLFGEPSATEPWGWQFFGHHLVLNCFVLGEQMVATPAFWGAEPNYADHGPFKGIRLFQDEERAGLKLMRAFSPEQQKRAIVAHSMMGGDLPEGRRHFADNLHLGGAFQDNRVVPYEGLKGDALNAAQRRDLMDLVEKYLAVLPDGPRRARIAEVERHLPDTHFCWIGGFSEDEPVLLPGAEPGHLHRVRPPRRRVPDQSGAGEIPRPHHRAHAERQRLRLRSAAAALQDVAASPAGAAATAGAASSWRWHTTIIMATARIGMITITAMAIITTITTTRDLSRIAHHEAPRPGVHRAHVNSSGSSLSRIARNAACAGTSSGFTGSQGMGNELEELIQ